MNLFETHSICSLEIILRDGSTVAENSSTKSHIRRPGFIKGPSGSDFLSSSERSVVECTCARKNRNFPVFTHQFPQLFRRKVEFHCTRYVFT